MTKERYLKVKNVLIMASGNGSNFEAIVKYFIDKGLKDRVCFELLTDKKDANVIKRAQKLGVPYFYVEFENLYDFLKNRKYDLYVLAGYMRILPEKILKLAAASDDTGEGYQNKFINIHPSLLPKFKGKDAIQRVHEAGVKKTGVTVHFVTKNVDSGKIITQKEIEIGKKTLTELEEAIHKIEHKIYPEVVENLLFKKNILLLGGGGREHVLARKLVKSPFLNQLYLAKPNDGFKDLGVTIDFPTTENIGADYQMLAKKAHALNIDLLIVGPENPLFDGIVDIFTKEGIKCIGADKKWARLEGSKSFAKIFMEKNGIKTADYNVLEDIASVLKSKAKIKEALEYFKTKGKIPPVIKADGAALGKGVHLPNTFEEAESEIESFLGGKFGDASKKIVLEERLFGREISIISLWDGNTLLSFPPALDYKRLLDNDKGANTGGMGAIAPSKISAKEKKQITEYLNTLKTALIKEKADFTGIIYSGLILTKDGVYVLEYNMRFGDPETQVLLELLDISRGVDLLDIFIKMSQKRLNEIDLKFKRKKAFCLVLASSGYPENPKKGSIIANLNSAKKYGCKIYFAGVKCTANTGLHTALNKLTLSAQEAQYNFTADSKTDLITNGGRVLNIVKSGVNSKKILDDIYKTAQDIDFDGKIYRKDIGYDKQNT